MLKLNYPSLQNNTKMTTLSTLCNYGKTRLRIPSVYFSQFLNSFYFQMWAKVRILFVHNLLYLAQLSDGLIPLQTLCEPGAEFPDNLIQCGSCENRCGSKINPDHFVSCLDREHKYLCSCDKFCGFHGDCCHDFQKFCLD